jgi:hypothetical protein
MIFLYKFRYLIYTSVGLAFVFSIVLFGTIRSSSETTYEFEKRAKSLNGVFATDQGKVYAMVPSNGYYELEHARAEAFKVLPDNFGDAHIGYDDRHVYAGNLIVKEVNPGGIRALGNNYYTDGTGSFYCSRHSERNKELGILKEVIQLIGYDWGLTGKPQTYWYKYVPLPRDGGPYESRLSYAMAVNEKQVYFKGAVLPDANPLNMQPIVQRRHGQREREGLEYFTDGKHVYYENQLLPLAYNETLYQPLIEGDVPSRNAHLVDEKNGMVYADGLAFDKEKAPYRILTAQLKHANQVLFAAKDGIYFYDAEAKKVRRAGSNPFKDTFEEIAPDVFKSGNKIYYLRETEHWGHKTGLQSRGTHLLELEGVEASGLYPIGDTSSRYSNVWQFGNRYFYFDGSGSSNGMSDAVYEIKDPALAQKITQSKNWRTDDILALHRSGQIVATTGNQLLTATTGYKNNDRALAYWVVGTGIVLALLLMYLLRNKTMPPFVIKNGWLIVNNLSFKRYLVTDIDKVIFRIVKSNPRAAGFSGRMQVVKRNGRTSRNYLFATKITLSPETEANLKLYIEKLQAQLSAQGVKSELAVQ